MDEDDLLDDASDLFGFLPMPSVPILAIIVACIGGLVLFCATR